MKIDDAIRVGLRGTLWDDKKIVSYLERMSKAHGCKDGPRNPGECPVCALVRINKKLARKNHELKVKLGAFAEALTSPSVHVAISDKPIQTVNPNEPHTIEEDDGEPQ